jgi:ABC-type transporter Mla MlaB component
VSSACAECTTIEFVGELTIKTIADAHSDLAAALTASDAVQAQVAEDAAVDLTFVQLLQSARRTAREAGAAFGLAAPAAGALRETLERGGFLSAPEDREFWLMQAEDR